MYCMAPPRSELGGADRGLTVAYSQTGKQLCGVFPVPQPRKSPLHCFAQRRCHGKSAIQNIGNVYSESECLSASE